MFHHARIHHVCQAAVLTLLTIVILWRGGKSIDSTWLLSGVSALCALALLWSDMAKRTHNGVHELSGKPIHHVLWLFTILHVLWTLMSYLQSSTGNYGLDEVFRTTSLALLFIWQMERPMHKPKRLRPTDRIPPSFDEVIIKWIAALTLITCIVGVFVYTMQPVNRFVGTFFDHRFHTDYWPNAYGEYLLLAWPLVYLTVRSMRWQSRWNIVVQIIVMSMVLSAMFLTYSRGTLIAFFGQLGILFVVLVLGKRTFSLLMREASFLLVCIACAIALFAGLNAVRSAMHEVQSVREKVTFTAAEGNSSINERRQFWHHAALLTIDKPLFGWGPYSFRFVHPQYQHHVLATSDHPHNLFLKIGMERGVVAAILLVIIVTLVVRQGLYLALGTKRLSSELDAQRTGFCAILMGIAGVIAHTLIDYNLQFVGVSMPLWLLMGMLMRYDLSAVPQKNTWLTRILHVVLDHRIALTAAIGAILLMATWREGWYLVTSSKGRHAEAVHNASAAVHWYEASRPEWFRRDMDLSRAHVYVDLGQDHEALRALHDYLRLNPYDARVWTFLGTLLREFERNNDAIDAYKNAFALGKWNDLRISRGLLETLYAENTNQAQQVSHQNLQHKETLRTIAPEIEDITRQFATAIHNNAHYVALSPNVEEALAILVLLSVLYPDKATEYEELQRMIEHKAKQARKKVAARPPGWLW